MIDRYLSIWEIAHRWRDVNPDKFDPTDLPLNVQDTLRYICRGVLDGRLNLYEMIVMQSPQGNNGKGYRSEIRPFYANECPSELEDCLYRRYNKNTLNAYFIEAENFFDYCLYEQVESSPTGNNRLDFPECWWHLSGHASSSSTDSDNYEQPTEVTSQTLRPSQIDKQICQAVAKTLWDIHPKMTITAMTKQRAVLLHGNGRLYQGKNTLRDWVREVAPENVKNNRGRPKSDKPSNDVA